MSPEVQAPPPARPLADEVHRAPRAPSRRLEAAVAVLGFAALCVVVLVKATRLLEPDDYAYQASIVALSQGHLLLTTAQYHALSRQLGDGGAGIPQWDHLVDGNWVSQKNPGYPFFAVVFQLLGILRLAPLFYGALACIGLFFGARRWLGRWGGTWAVLLYCTSGAAITFAWRPTMPSFTDASLIAAGAGALLWTMLATDAPERRRLVVGLLAFLGLEGATFIRYTDLFELVVATVAVVLLARRCRLPLRTVTWWVSSAVLFGAGMCIFDALVYGSPFNTGYDTGTITFTASALPGNLEHMPIRLIETMPMVVPAIVAIVWIAWRLVRDHLGQPSVAHLEHDRDGAVAGVLFAGWCAIWGLYFAYTWTLSQFSGDPVHVVRFYLPTIGLIALLGAWTIAHLPRLLAFPALVLALVLGVLSFNVMAAGAAPGGPGGPPGGVGGVGAPPGARTGGLPGAKSGIPGGSRPGPGNPAGGKAGTPPPRGPKAGGGPPVRPPSGAANGGSPPTS